MRFSERDFLEVSVFDELNRGFAEIAALRGVGGILPLDLAAGTATVPTAAFINTIERNLERLGVAGTKVWIGEDRDAQWLSYRDVNRWFEGIESLRGL
ncbi:MAG: hypothetical protein FWB74_02425 [Defluviitaleaceae bacterium]|nr:hypothetical protein [Defluviitaleaceae bacterium]